MSSRGRKENDRESVQQLERVVVGLTHVFIS
jgi:hypothetical protein